MLFSLFRKHFFFICYYTDRNGHCLLKCKFKVDLPGLSSPCKDFCCFCRKGSSGWEGLKAGLPPLPLIQKSNNLLVQEYFSITKEESNTVGEDTRVIGNPFLPLKHKIMSLTLMLKKLPKEK